MASGLRDSSGNTVGVDRLHDEMNDMKLWGEKEIETTVIDGKGTEAGQIIFTTISGKNGEPKQMKSYMAERVVGNGSFGVVFQSLFSGERAVDQLMEIIKILGTPTREEIKCMNPDYTEFKFPQIKAYPWLKIFHKLIPPEAVDLVSRLLQYSPNLGSIALEALVHPFYDELHDPSTCLPNGRHLSPLFNF